MASSLPLPAAHAHGTSHIGRRENNEDTFRVCEDLGLFLVADGMGGHEGGEIASELVAETVAEYLGRATSALGLPEIDCAVSRGRRKLTQAISLAREEVERRATGDLAEMGTTLAALLVRDDRAIVAHVGDSRVYRLREGLLEQLTVDHSFVAELRAAGIADMLGSLPEEMSAMVTRCIAAAANSEPEVSIHRLQSGDVFLLCSDGLTDVMSSREIQMVLEAYPEPEDAAHELNRLAFELGSQDNITSVVVHAGRAVRSSGVRLAADS